MNVKPLNRSKPIVTYALIAVLGVVFVLDELSAMLFFRSDGLLRVLGMKVNGWIAQGQYWRILSANFLHNGLSHLFANGLGLYIWGRYIETFYGRSRYALVLLGSGVACVALSYACSPAASLGASGMVFGLYGALLGVRKFNRELFNRIFGVQILVYIAFSVLMGFLGGGVDNFGHIGGLLGGFLVSRVVCILPESKPVWQRMAYMAAYLLFVGLCLWVGTKGFVNGL